MDKNHNIDLLIVSCDKYSDVWDLFFSEFFKSWEACPLDIYLLTNFISYSNPHINSIKVSEDKSWSDNLMNGIDQLKKDYVLLLMEDLLLINKISSQYFNEISNWIDENKPNYLRLTNSHTLPQYDSLVGKIPAKTPYKTSAMPCVWKRNILRDILKSGESAWEFETRGSIRAYSYSKFFSLRTNFIEYHNSIIKGKWRQSILNYDIEKDSLVRPIMSNSEEWLYYTKKIKSKCFNTLPNWLKLLFKD